MIVRRYGSKVHQVRPQFDARALTEISFQRMADSWPADEFLETHDRVDSRDLTAYAEGAVKDEVEQAILSSLREQLEKLEAEQGEGSVLLVENQPGTDHPKTRDRTSNEVIAGERRLHFSYTVAPPLRVAVLRPKSG